jgi:hypothetical protein
VKRKLDFLDGEEEAVLRRVAASWRSPTWMPDLDVHTWADVVLLTGVHLAVQADPAGHRYRLEHVDGIDYLLWNRPKNHAAIAFPLNAAPEALARVRSWLDWLYDRRYSTRNFQRMIGDLGAAAGIPGLPFLRLRHTAIERFARKPGVSMSRLCQLFGITPQIAMMYQTGPQRDRDLQDVPRIERWN